MPKDSVRKLSFTFSVDVVKFIQAFMTSEQADTGTSSFKAVNLACEEKVTLVELLETLEQ